MKRTTGAAIAAVVASGLFAAPTAAATTPDDVVTLTIGTNSSGDRPMGFAISEFAGQVDELSGGSIRIDLVFGVHPGEAGAGGEYNDWDQFVARKVVSGELDMGIVPARAWDTEGVTTLRALFAPLLVDSDALSATIAADDELAGELLAGLDEVGITGLALVPESMRQCSRTRSR